MGARFRNLLCLNPPLASAEESAARKGQPEALGDVEKRGGRDQVVVLVEHSHEQLVLAHLAGVQVEDRLGEHGRWRLRGRAYGFVL